MNFEYFTELTRIGLKPIPINWSNENKAAISHVIKHSEITNENWDEIRLRDFMAEIDQANGIALKLFPPFGMIDFDVKNTENKTVFTDWLNIIESTNPELLRKICIESTRNGGNHVYIKFPELSSKKSVACNPSGGEVISVYTGGLLSYCSPTPGYEMFHNSFDDLHELTPDEFDLLVTTAALFNEYEQLGATGSGGFAQAEYPQEYELTCLQFDALLPVDAWEMLLNSITLRKTKLRHKPKRKYDYVPYLRDGSSAAYSAKVFNDPKRLLLFTCSLPDFPSYNDYKHSGAGREWVLTPSKIIYYKHKRDWPAAIQEINTICDSVGITIEQPKQRQHQIQPRATFPYDIFPEEIQQYIKSFSIQHEYTAGFMLGALATAVGNTCVLDLPNQYRVHSTIYLAVVAPAGGSKSPAMRAAFSFLKKVDNESYLSYQNRMKHYADEQAHYEKNKRNAERPTKPIYKQILFDDATIESVVNILSYNPEGVCLLADELAGFMKRMNKYSDGDDLQKWLSIWDGSDITLQRASKEMTRANDYTCCVVGGIQPGVLNILSRGENEHNGFYHRFLFVYPEQQPKQPFYFDAENDHMHAGVAEIFDRVLMHRQNPVKTRYRMNPDAAALYKEWFDWKNKFYDAAHDDNSKGIIAKYQGYCLRFALILQAIEDQDFRAERITLAVMDRAIRLTEYFFANMVKAIKVLRPENPVEQLRAPYDKLYQELPQMFTIKTGTQLAEKYRVKPSTFKDWVQRSGNLFARIDRGSYEKSL